MAKLQISWPSFFRSSCSAVGDFGAGCGGCAAGAVAGAAGPGSWDFLRCKVTRPTARTRRPDPEMTSQNPHGWFTHGSPILPMARRMSKSPGTSGVSTSGWDQSLKAHHLRAFLQNAIGQGLLHLRPDVLSQGFHLAVGTLGPVDEQSQ